VKIVSKAIILLFLAIILTACNSSASRPMTNPTDVMETAISIVKTEVIMTQAAIPTATYPPPTVIPPGAYSDGSISPPPAARLDNAVTIAKTVHSFLPYSSEISFELYWGCAETNDFQNLVTYLINFPEASIDIIKKAFEKRIRTEGWKFTEVTSESLNSSVTRLTYDVYRISSQDAPAFERLKVIFLVTSPHYIDVRAILTHIETKESLGYISKFRDFEPSSSSMCHDNSWWQH
jgi:hypothetical protein